MTKHGTGSKSSGGNTTKRVQGDHGREEWYTTKSADGVTREEGGRGVDGSSGTHSRSAGGEESWRGFESDGWSERARGSTKVRVHFE